MEPLKALEMTAFDSWWSSEKSPPFSATLSPYDYAKAAWQAAFAASPQAGAQREGGELCGHRFLMRGSHELHIPDAYSLDACELPKGHAGQHNCKDAKWGESATPAPSEGNESARERIASMAQQPEAPRLGVPPRYGEPKR